MDPKNCQVNTICRFDPEHLLRDGLFTVVFPIGTQGIVFERLLVTVRLRDGDLREQLEINAKNDAAQFR